MKRGVTVAIDPGTVRHGVAISDELGITAVPFAVIDARPEGEAIRRIIVFLKRKKAARLVMGLPLNMDGTEGPSAKASRMLAEKITAEYSIPVVFVDERLSTVEAESRLAERGATNKQRKKKVDALAAQVILSDYLNSPDD